MSETDELAREGLTLAEWEEICDGCGKCCGFGGCNIACPALNVKTNRCTNYVERLEREICVSLRPGNILTLHSTGVLPDSCAYVLRAQKKPPLEHIEKAALMPFASAPLSVRRAYARNRRKWLKIVNETDIGKAFLERLEGVDSPTS